MVFLFLSTLSGWASSADESFDLYGIQSAVESAHAKTPQEVMSVIEATALGEDSVRFFMFRSESTMPATPAHPGKPRMLDFRADGQLMVASSDVAPRIEFIEFNPQLSRFEFREIDLSSNSPRFLKHDSDHACIGCHAGRPNWDMYPSWPGFYLGSNEELQNFSTKLVPREAKLASAFNKSQSDHSVYPNHVDFYANNDFESMTTTLENLNVKRVGALVKRTPLFKRYRYALGAAAAGCDDIESYVGTKPGIQTYAQYLKETENRHASYARDRAVLLGRDSGVTPFRGVIEDSETAAKLGFVAQYLELTGADTFDHWSMARFSETFGRSPGWYRGFNLPDHLSSYYGFYGEFLDNAVVDCEKLKRESRRSLGLR